MHILIMYSPHAPSEDHIRQLEAEDGITEVTVATDEQTALDAASDVEVILGHRYLRQCLPRAEKLRWVQSTTQGIDRLPCAALSNRNVQLTRYTGSAPIVARHGVSLAWAVTRRIPTASRQQLEKRWDKDLEWLPHPKRALVFGTGMVGREIARLLRAHGIRVSGVKHTVEHSLPEFDDLYDRHSWQKALSLSDWCFLALPNTPKTQNMIDAEALGALPSHAVVVNVGRGETLDLDALTEMLWEGRLGGAALDVLPAEMEPLGSSSNLWTVPRLVLTPHVASYHPQRRERVEQFCEKQVRRYTRGEPLEAVVDLEGDAGEVSEHTPVHRTER